MDQSFLYYMNRTLANPLLDSVMIFFTTVGFGSLLFVGMVLVWRKPKTNSGAETAVGYDQIEQKMGRAVLWAFFFGMVYTGVFYYLALRPRPMDVRLLLTIPAFPSFPSGHTSGAFAVAMVLALGSNKLPIANRIGPTLFTLGVFLFAAMIGISRIYLGHHFPSDIVGGMVAGIGVGAAAYGLFVYEGNHLQRVRWLLWPQISIALTVTQMAYLGFLPEHLLTWPLADKVFHFTLFGAIVFWFNLWLEGRTIRLWRWAVPIAIAVPFAVAFIEEGLQALSPLRTADVTDLIADMAGMVSFWWLSKRFLGQNVPETASIEAKIANKNS